MALRVVADENVPAEAVEAMRREGHDVVWVVTDAPGSSDEAILAWAQTEDRIVMTFDKDFGELAFHRGRQALSGIILFRLEAPGAAHATNVVVGALRSRSDWPGHFSVVEESRIRMTPLPHAREESP